MLNRQAMMTINLLALALALVIAGNIVLVRPTVPPWLASVTWQVVKPLLACPYLMPPECVDPVPGL
jgi:hypothetical protein